MSGSLPARRLTTLSSFWRGLPLPNILVAAVMAAMGMRFGYFALMKSTKPTDADLLRDLLLVLATGETEERFIDLFHLNKQYNLTHKISAEFLSSPAAQHSPSSASLKEIVRNSMN